MLLPSQAPPVGGAGAGACGAGVGAGVAGTVEAGAGAGVVGAGVGAGVAAGGGPGAGASVVVGAGDGPGAGTGSGVGCGVAGEPASEVHQVAAPPEHCSQFALDCAHQFVAPATELQVPQALLGTRADQQQNSAAPSRGPGAGVGPAVASGSGHHLAAPPEHCSQFPRDCAHQLEGPATELQVPQNSPASLAE
mmetsp:Transcript_42976/g.133142  ORF Transcript_42976/g.133142 Transcript_42976/m.133142 type:complete len:193 (+) Transcript_42976:47-625(+)